MFEEPRCTHDLSFQEPLHQELRSRHDFGQDFPQLLTKKSTGYPYFWNGGELFCDPSSVVLNHFGDIAEVGAFVEESCSAFLKTGGGMRWWWFLRDLPSHYSHFNVERAEGCRSLGFLPVSTAVHCPSMPCDFAGFCVLFPASNVRVFKSSCTQSAPELYGSSFSRAMICDYGSGKFWAVSGTAAIDSLGRTIASGDPIKQKRIAIEMTDFAFGYNMFKTVNRQWWGACSKFPLPTYICRPDIACEVESCGFLVQ